MKVTAREVQPGWRIKPQGFMLGDLPFWSVEDVRIRKFDGMSDEFDVIELTVWPPNLGDPALPQPTSVREHNFGHFYAQYMMTLTVLPMFPIEVDDTSVVKPSGMTLAEANQAAIDAGI